MSEDAEMEKVKDIIKLMEVITLTSYVKGGNPVSALIIAKAESGKTEILKILKGYKHTIFLNDLSFKPLTETLFPLIKEGKLKHIIVADFINVTQHKKSADNLIPVLNSLMEEGVSELAYYGSQAKFTPPLNCGLLTGITKRYFDKHIIFWRQIGFLTRMIPISYSYSASTVLEINTAIMNQEKRKDESVVLPNLKTLLDIKITKPIAMQLQTISEMLCNTNSVYISIGDNTHTRKIEMESYGFRLHKIIRNIAKALSIYNSKGKGKEVTQEDVTELTKLIAFVNFNFKEV